MKKLLPLVTMVMLMVCIVFASAYAEDWTCPSCGNTASGNFCNNCGTAKPSGDWICPVCGNHATSNFCCDCGTPRYAGTPAPEATAAVTLTPAPTSTPVPCERTGEGYTITQEYKWATKYYYYYAMAVKNTSGEKCGFDVNVVFYDSENNIIGVSNQSENVCDNGYEVLITFSSDTDFDHVGYTVTLTSSKYNDIHSYVTVTAQIVGNKVILVGSNTGTVAAKYVEYYCLFINNADEVVDSARGYLDDSDSELKSGKQEVREEKCSDDFTSVIVYYTGRTNKSVVNEGTVEIIPAAQNVTIGEGYEVTNEYTWSSSKYNYYAIAVKNTSSNDCEFDVQTLYYDKDNNIIGVSNQKADVCGSNSEVLIICSTKDQYDHLGYTVLSTNTNYTDVHDFVTVTTSISGKKVILTATNNGTDTAKYVEYHCLFLDENGKVVDSGRGYLDDNDSELKPGNSEMREEKCNSNFSSVIVYFEGRRSK